MSNLYQKKRLDLVYTSNQHVRTANGRITKENMLSLKSMEAKRTPAANPFSAVHKALSTVFCFLFRPKFTEGPVAESEVKVWSEKTSGFLF